MTNLDMTGFDITSFDMKSFDMTTFDMTSFDMGVGDFERIHLRSNKYSAESNSIFCSAKKNLSKFFVRATKYTKMFGPSCSLFWHIDIENLLIRLKAVMVALEISETEDSVENFE